MKPFLKRALIGICGGLIVLGSLGACAGRGPGGWGPEASNSAEFKARMVEKISGKLDLDAAQKQKLGVLADTLQAQRAALRGAAEPRDSLRALMAGTTFDQAAATRLVEEKTAAVRAGSPEVIKAAADFFDNLKPEQQQKVREIMERGRRWGHHG